MARQRGSPSLYEFYPLAIASCTSVHQVNVCTSCSIRRCLFCGCSFDKFKEMVDGFAGFGEFGTEGTWLFTKQFIFHLQMMWLLSCPKDSIDVEQVFAGLKGPEVATEYMLTRTNANGEPVTWNHTYFNTIDSCLFAALAHERFGYDEQALAFAVMTCEEDLSKGGNEIAWTRSLAKSCRGRYYTKRGQYDEAQTQFQEAADLARFYKYGFIEALVLRDWHQYLEEHGYVTVPS